jgi:hypothetical protein
MPYPRELVLDQETEDRLIAYIEEELTNHYAERSGHIEDLQRYQRDYWAKPTNEVATFPFRNAATIVIPLDAIAVEAIHARVDRTMFALDQFVSAKAISPEWEHVDRAVERHLDYELMVQMRIRKPLTSCFLESEKFGTMTGKVGYVREEKWSVREIGGIEQDFRVVTKNGPQFDAVSDARFLMPHSALDPQTAHWCGEEHEDTPYRVMMLEQAGFFKEGTILGEDAKLRQWATQTSPQSGAEGGQKFDNTQKTLENTKSQWPKTINWLELWIAFNVDGDPDGRMREIVVHYHRDARCLMSTRYNWNHDLRRPYPQNVYFPVEHRWRGIGICKMNEQFQKEITTQHRQRIDNATLANMRMIKIHKLSQYGPNEPIFPGKMWFLDNMDHLETIQMGEIYPSSYQNENAAMVFSQQRTGVNEATLGMPQAGTPGTATAEMARVQEGNKKFDLIFANMKEFATDVITDTASVIQQFGPRRVEYYNTAENGQLVKQFYDMPAELIRNGLLISLKASGQTQNKILDRQNWQQIAQFINMYYNGLMQLAMPTGDKKLIGSILYKGMGAATEAMRQIFESYDIRNIDRLIVKELDPEIRNALASLNPTQPGGTGEPSGDQQVPGMGNGGQALQPAGANGNGRFDFFPGQQ